MNGPRDAARARHAQAVEPMDAMPNAPVSTPVSQFSVPGHATRREFAVYVVVAHQRGTADFHLYVGKTGDNRDGCNPVISRAGNHFSYNDVHSQVRNKLSLPPSAYDYEYFYVTFGPYDALAEGRRSSIDLVNEMERATNLALQEALPEAYRSRLLNPCKASARLSSAEKAKRKAFRTPDRCARVEALVQRVMWYVSSLQRMP